MAGCAPGREFHQAVYSLRNWEYPAYLSSLRMINLLRKDISRVGSDRELSSPALCQIKSGSRNRAAHRRHEFKREPAACRNASQTLAPSKVSRGGVGGGLSASAR